MCVVAIMFFILNLVIVDILYFILVLATNNLLYFTVCKVAVGSYFITFILPFPCDLVDGTSSTRGHREYVSGQFDYGARLRHIPGANIPVVILISFLEACKASNELKSCGANVVLLLPNLLTPTHTLHISLHLSLTPTHKRHLSHSLSFSLCLCPCLSLSLHIPLFLCV